MFKSESNTQPAGLAMFSNADENFMNLIDRVSDDEAQMLQGGNAGFHNPSVFPDGPKGLVKNEKFDILAKVTQNTNGKKKGWVPVRNNDGGSGGGGW